MNRRTSVASGCAFGARLCQAGAAAVRGTRVSSVALAVRLALATGVVLWPGFVVARAMGVTRRLGCAVVVVDGPVRRRWQSRSPSAPG